MSSKNLLVTTTDKMAKEGINDREAKPNVVKEDITHTIAKTILAQSTKQRNHKHLKLKKINPSAINQTKVDHWINQGLLKELKHNT